MSLLTTELTTELACALSMCPFNVNKCDVADRLLPHGATEVSFQSAQRTE